MTDSICASDVSPQSLTHKVLMTVSVAKLMGMQYSFFFPLTCRKNIHLIANDAEITIKHKPISRINQLFKITPKYPFHHTTNKPIETTGKPIKFTKT